MTLIEVVVAAFCMALIIAAASTLFAIGNDSSVATQRQSQLVSLADQEIESIRQQLKTNSNGFGALAMNSLPAAATNSTLPSSATIHTDPNDFVSTSSGCGTSNEGYLIEANYDNTGLGVVPSAVPWTGCTTGSEPLVVATGGIVTPSQTVSVGSATATIDAYVTDTYLGCNSSVGSCSSTTGDAKRVIVAVVMSNGGTNNIGSSARYNTGPNSPVYVSTVFTNPVPSNQVNSSIGLTLGATIG